mmetsp:Transcript_19826/g.24034  ORF Transcript_19826/g.24034 Transcript_19826/m.24034 type:complete len:135 (-) Transcript_19826:1088-1492(-)
MARGKINSMSCALCICLLAQLLFQMLILQVNAEDPELPVEQSLSIPSCSKCCRKLFVHYNDIKKKPCQDGCSGSCDNSYTEWVDISSCGIGVSMINNGFAQVGGRSVVCVDPGNLVSSSLVQTSLRNEVIAHLE